MRDVEQGIRQCGETSRQLVEDAGALVLDADHRIGDGTFGSAQWAQSARRMVNLAVTAGYQLSAAAMSQCADDVELSEFLEAPPSKASRRALSIAAPFVAEGSSRALPPQAMVLVPSLLRTYATRFRVGVRGPDYVSGTYRGRIRLTSLPANTGQVQEIDVIVDL